MKIIFAGTPQFAVNALKALIENNHEIVAVLSQPDRPAGRGMHLVQSPVKKFAIANNLHILQPESLKKFDIQQQLDLYKSDVMVVAAYGLILPLKVLQIPKYGCINIHASLLPRWRGAAPIQRAILAGDSETGITIMRMDQGLDTGAMLLKKTYSISLVDTVQTLHDKLAMLGAEAIIEVINNLAKGKLIETIQDETKVTYAAKINKTEAQIDWNQDMENISKFIRGYNPVPGAYSYLKGTKIKILQASETAGRKGTPGTIIEIEKTGIKVTCRNGALNVHLLQRPNAKVLPAYEFIQGFSIKVGERFTTL